MTEKYSLPSSRKVLAGRKYRNKQQNHITGKKGARFPITHGSAAGKCQTGGGVVNYRQTDEQLKIGRLAEEAKFT